VSPGPLSSRPEQARQTPKADFKPLANKQQKGEWLSSGPDFIFVPSSKQTSGAKCCPAVKGAGSQQATDFCFTRRSHSGQEHNPQEQTCANGKFCQGGMETDLQAGNPWEPQRLCLRKGDWRVFECARTAKQPYNGPWGLKSKLSYPLTTPLSQILLVRTPSNSRA